MLTQFQTERKYKNGSLIEKFMLTFKSADMNSSPQNVVSHT